MHLDDQLAVRFFFPVVIGISTPIHIVDGGDGLAGRIENTQHRVQGLTKRLCKDTDSRVLPLIEQNILPQTFFFPRP